MREVEQEDVVVVGWLRGDDYEAALACRRRDADPRREPSHEARQSLGSRLGRRVRPR